MTSEMLFIALLALLLFGPRRLPEMARQLGRFMADFRRASSEFQNQINEEIRKLDEEEKPAQSILPTASQPPGTEPMSLTGAINRLTDRIKSGSQEYDA
ncbi:MAG TPA: twin-arginine translocase TatA/TatE family subunit [Alphaproteobacteria bacterium]|nr:twin-arginine translocase TatA/TatE family subunit [Alphaproteobacteria bacterium]